MTLGRVLLYTNRIEAMIAFYTAHFGYSHRPDPDDRIHELTPASGDGATILLHVAGKGRRQGQTLVKLVFDVEDVAAAREAMIAQGVEVGPIHDAGDYGFANLTDPSGNPVSISGRAFRAER
jgi:predicted enzyme related to lactoylglutathione lyase